MSAAQRAAIEGARELLAEAIKHGLPRVPEAFVIADETGRKVFELRFTEVLPEPLKK